MAELEYSPETPLTDDEVFSTASEYIDAVRRAIEAAKSEHSLETKAYKLDEVLINGKYHTPRVSLLNQRTERPLTEDVWERTEAEVDIFPATVPVITVPSYHSSYSRMRITTDRLTKKDGSVERSASIHFLPPQEDQLPAHDPPEMTELRTHAHLEQVRQQPVGKFLTQLPKK